MARILRIKMAVIDAIFLKLGLNLSQFEAKILVAGSSDNTSSFSPWAFEIH
jgi:hypothetical protein